MTKFRNIIGRGILGVAVVLQAIAAVFVPSKSADAATRDDSGSHKDRVSSDQGLRFELDEKATAALGEAEQYVQVAQAGGSPRTAQDVVADGIQALSNRGVDVQQLQSSGVLDDAIQTLVAQGDIAPPEVGDLGDVEDVVETLDAGDIQEILVTGS